MNNIEITRKEFHSILLGFSVIPIMVFVLGFYLGSGQGVMVQSIVPTPLADITSIKEFDADVVVQTEPTVTPAETVVVARSVEELPEIAVGRPLEVVMSEPLATTELDRVPVAMDVHPSLYAVQLGSFSSAINADRYKASLQSRGIGAQVLDSTDSGDGHVNYRVIAGLYQTAQDAKSYAEQHKQRFNEDAYVAVVPTT